MFHPRVSTYDANLIFVACDMLAVYRSTDGGLSWTMCHTRQVHGSPSFSVAFDPANQNRVIGYHRLLGLRESTDRGMTWHDYLAPAPAAVANNLELTAAAFSSTGELILGTT